MTKEVSSANPPNFIQVHAANNPDKPAIIGMHRTLTYSQLHEKSRALASSLYKLGLRPGDQAAVMSYNLPENSIYANAIYTLRAGNVGVGYKMKTPEIEYILDNSDAKIFMFYHEFADRIMPFKDQFKKILPNGLISFGGPPVEGALDLETLISNPPDVDLEKIQQSNKSGNSMVYTSGTTGRPKGAARNINMAERAGIMEYFMTSISIFNFKPDEVHLVCCPLYHSAPAYMVGTTFMLGGTLIYMTHFRAETFLEIIATHKATSTFVVPTMISRLLDLPDSVIQKYDISSLRTVICAAAPLFPEQKLKFMDRFGDCLYEFYGSTETGINTVITPKEIRERPASVGKPFANNKLKIYDDAGNEVEDGKSGILYMFNYMMMDGYYKNEKATQESCIGKYLTAGDVAIRDEDGYYYIVDRIKDMIIRGGVNIYPAEVEEILLKMPGIIDAAVVGKKDSEMGETVAAFIVLNDNVEISETEIQEYCMKSLANYKVPATIIFSKDIPRTPTGKILKKDLRLVLEGSV